MLDGIIITTLSGSLVPRNLFTSVTCFNKSTEHRENSSSGRSSTKSRLDNRGEQECAVEAPTCSQPRGISHASTGGVRATPRLWRGSLGGNPAGLGTCSLMARTGPLNTTVESITSVPPVLQHAVPARSLVQEQTKCVSIQIDQFPDSPIASVVHGWGSILSTVCGEQDREPRRVIPNGIKQGRAPGLTECWVRYGHGTSRFGGFPGITTKCFCLVAGLGREAGEVSTFSEAGHLAVLLSGRSNNNMDYPPRSSRKLCSRFGSLHQCSITSSKRWSLLTMK
ncbi:hypothetical protein RRG08_031313 [Elysia crispata]|uniref:Uncharacterized protein n=1 Tax=Elysia crispata TaxID=231223 RepID=A0AAE0YIK0_9GAST|nr:hypothetical protein RRG08_031313 [Elysia crispata]